MGRKQIKITCSRTHTLGSYEARNLVAAAMEAVLAGHANFRTAAVQKNLKLLHNEECMYPGDCEDPRNFFYAIVGKVPMAVIASYINEVNWNDIDPDDVLDSGDINWRQIQASPRFIDLVIPVLNTQIEDFKRKWALQNQKESKAEAQRKANELTIRCKGSGGLVEESRLPGSEDGKGTTDRKGQEGASESCRCRADVSRGLIAP